MNMPADVMERARELRTAIRQDIDARTLGYRDWVRMEQVETLLADLLAANEAPLWLKLESTSSQARFLGYPDVEYQSPDGLCHISIWEAASGRFTWRIITGADGNTVQHDCAAPCQSMASAKRLICKKLGLLGLVVRVEQLP